MRTDFRHVWRDCVTGEIIVHEPTYALDDLETGEVFEADLKRLWARARQAMREARFYRHNASLRLVNPRGEALALFIRRGDFVWWGVRGRA